MPSKNGKINSLTNAQLILICQQIITATKIELTYANNSYDQQLAVRAVAFRSLAEIWYEITPEKVKQKYNYDFEKFKETVWPEKDW